MWIVNLETYLNGSHDNHRADHITAVPEGWAMIPEDFPVPSTFPFVSIEAEEITYTRKVEAEGEDGEIITEYVPYSVRTVTAMTEGVVPPVHEPEPTWSEQMEAQITYTAMMTDTLLEV